MTEPNGTTENGPETMKKSEAVARTLPADARTKTPSLNATEKNIPTTSTQKEAVAVSTARLEAPNSKPPSKTVMIESQGRNSAPIVQKNSKSSSTVSSSKDDAKEAPKSQTKEQSRDRTETMSKGISISSAAPPVPAKLIGGGNDSGNDRVTMDKKPNKPLIPESKGSSINRKPGNAKVDSRSMPSVKATTALGIKNSLTKPSAAATITRQPPTTSQSSSTNPVLTKKTLPTNSSSSNISKKNQVTSAPNSDMDDSTNSIGDEELQRQRAPLTEKYNPYITHSDTSLADARRRLQIALDQTRQLRAAFTERVYGKYRVCLQPPPQTQDIIKTVKDDPSGMHRKLELELKRITDEKNAEKRESQKINSSDAVAQIPPTSSTSANAPAGSNTNAASTGAPNNSNSNAASSASSNADSAEQNLYVTSGLSLIVLPEDNIPDIDMSMYRERAPINPKTSQRVKGISAAAATSGKLMLERARQGKVARADREKRLLQKVNQKAHNFFDRNYYSRSPHFKTLGTLATAKQPLMGARNVSSTAHKTKPKLLPSRPRGSQKAGEGRKIIGVKRVVAPKAVTKVPAGQTAAGAKAIRARVQTPMTVQTLLNLNPIHEELRTDTKYSAATLAMMERGVGTFQGPTTQYHKNTPHRFKHPFPDSLGGRRRPVTSAGGIADASNATNAQLTLPPVPSVKERRRHKKITVLSRTEAGTTRAALSIRKILDQFTPSSNKAAIAIESIETQENPLLGRPKKHRKISEIGFVRGLYLDSLEEMGSSTSNANQGAELMKRDNGGIDSTLTLNVLKAVGLIKSSVSSDTKSEKFAFETSLASSLFKETPATDSGPYSYSISKLKELEQKLSTQKRSFTAAFYSDTDKFGIESSTVVQNNEKDPDKKIQPKASAPLAIRGGGSGSGSTSEGKESVKSPDKKSETGGKAAKNSKIGKSPKRKLNMAQNQTMSAAATQANLMRQNLIREERLQQQRLASLQAQGVAQQHSAQLQAQLQSADHYRQTNALQLAHQLRLSRLQAHGHSGAGDLTDYISGLHHSPQAQAAYGWSQASAAAAVANSNNLAALGLNPNGVMPLTVEDRTRVLLAREQQNLAACVAAAQRQQAVALMRGMAVVDTPFAQAGYPHIPGQLLNPTAAALIARQGLQNRAMNASPQKASMDHKAVSQKAKPEAKNSQKSLSVDRDAPKAQSSQQNEKKNQQSSNAANQNKNNDKKTDARNSNVSVNKKRKNSIQNGKGSGQSEKRKRTSSVGKSDDRSNQSSTNVPKSPSKSSKSKASERTKASERKTSRDKPSEGAKPKRSDSYQSQDKTSSTKKEDKPPTSSDMDKASETQKKNPAKISAGLQYYVPEAPPGISSDFATLVLAGRCHEAIGVSVYRDLACEGLRVVNYITSVGMAVPIPKTVVMNPLKDRMNGLVFKNSNVGSMPASSRDIIAAVILLWLWRNQEGCFQRAFAKSGRIDVDPECKWFINAAVNKAVTALSNEVIGSTSRANGLTTALLAHKSKSSSGQKGVHGKAEQDSLKTTTTKIDLLAASVVSKSLNMTLVLNEDMNSAIPQFNNLVDYLDECRKCALFAKSQERALLAAVVSRKATMSLSFSHAYVSAMVRAGEALGHGPLFEVVQNEKHGVSTMIPYDVFTDESGAWEDPCRPPTGFTKGLTGDELMRRAHTRAMIQKSLKKLQDRQNVKGGTTILGPYVELNSSAMTSSSNKANAGTSRGGSQRRRSSFSEPSIQSGSGSAAATSWSLYNPNHQSPPLEWDANAMDNAPYGRFDKSTRPRSLSLAQGAAILRNSGRGQRRRRSASGGSKIPDVQNEQGKRSIKAEAKKDADGDHRSTREIPWGDIAGIFQKVELPSAIKEQKEKESKMSVKERTIFAPIVSWPNVIPVANEDESDEEEDLSDETILGRHRVVLDRMKARLSSVMENKKRNQQDRRKSRDKSSK